MFEKIRNVELGRGLLVYLISVTGIALLAVILLLLFWNKPAAPIAAGTPNTILKQEDFPYSSIRVPEDKLQLVPSDPVLLRDRRSSWTDEEVHRYWIPLDPIVSELLQKENEKIVEDIFANVP